MANPGDTHGPDPHTHPPCPTDAACLPVHHHHCRDLCQEDFPLYPEPIQLPDGATSETCHCRARGPCTAPLQPENPPRMGRPRGLRLATVLSRREKKMKMMKSRENVEFVEMDLGEDLNEQWAALEANGERPDFLITKISADICGATENEVAAGALNNYLAFRTQHDAHIQSLELVPFQASQIVCDRERMGALIERVCDGVNLSEGLVPIPAETDAGSATVDTPIPETLGPPFPFRSPKSVVVRWRRPTIETLISETEAEAAAEAAAAAAAAGELEAAAEGMAAEEETEERKNLHRTESEKARDREALLELLALVPFPAIAKPLQSDFEESAIVADVAAADDFLRRSERDLLFQQFVEHDGRLLKLFVVGKTVYLVKRSPLPNFPPVLSPESLAGLAKALDGEVVPLKESPKGGYVVFDLANLKKRRRNFGFCPVDECAMVGAQTFNRLAQSFTDRLNFSLLGVDIVCSPTIGSNFVVDVSVFPGYGGVEGVAEVVVDHLVDLAIERAFKIDCRNLRPRDVLETATLYNADWRRRHVAPEKMLTRRLSTNHVYEVRFAREKARKDVECRQSLVSLKVVDKPQRFLQASEDFSFDVSHALYGDDRARQPIVNALEATYFTRRRRVGIVRHWMKGKPLHIRLIKAEDIEKMDGVFRKVGVALVDFHRLIEDDRVKSLVLEPHFPLGCGAGESYAGAATDCCHVDVVGAATPPVSDAVAEENPSWAPTMKRRARAWGRDAALAVVAAKLGETQNWKQLQGKILEAFRNFDSIESTILSGLRTPEASALVFGHSDCGAENVFVHGSTLEEAEVALIGEEWAGPNVAVYDLAKFACSLTILRLRGMTPLDELAVKDAVAKTADAYLRARRAPPGETGVEAAKPAQAPAAAATQKPETLEVPSTSPQSPSKIIVNVEMVEDEVITPEEAKLREAAASLTEDVWSFVPLVAIVTAFGAIVYASKNGQLDDPIDPDIGVLRRCDKKFNWLRHARDHVTIFGEWLPSE